MADRSLADRAVRSVRGSPLMETLDSVVWPALIMMMLHSRRAILLSTDSLLILQTADHCGELATSWALGGVEASR